jgi:hypothetical protein
MNSVVIENSVFIGNQLIGENGSGLEINVYSGSLPFSLLKATNSIFAYNEGMDIHVDTGLRIEVYSSDLYSPTGVTHNIPLSADNLEVEPGFLTYDDQGMPTNFHLALNSPLVDAGMTQQSDADGSRSDIGLYGGEFGDGIDADLDGVFDYFWPGTIDDAPPGFDPADYDRNDQDASVQ